MDIVSIILTLTFTSITLFEFDTMSMESLRVMAAITIFFVLLKVYDWLRLFEITAFFVLLVSSTLIDVLPFLILLAVALSMFSIPMTFLNFNNLDEETLLVSPYMGFYLVDGLINQYLLALGEFESLGNF